MHQFLLLGGDPRQLCLSRILSGHGQQVISYYDPSPDFSLEKSMKGSDIILCPVPFTKDRTTIFSVNGLAGLDIDAFLPLLREGHALFGGNIPFIVREHCSHMHIPCLDYMKLEAVTQKNTIATAEGALAEAISLSPMNLHQSRCLVTGWGRCARTLAHKLKGLDAQVTVAGRSMEKLAQCLPLGYESMSLSELGPVIHQYDFIFNTIPALVLDKSLIASMDRDAAVIDIATAPGGVDFHACRETGIRAKLCPGLPGIYSPKASALILYEAVMEHL